MVLKNGVATTGRSFGELKFSQFKHEQIIGINREHAAVLDLWGGRVRLKTSGRFLLVCLCLFFSFYSHSSLAFGEDDKEDDVRAAIIMAILRYTTWEADIEVFNICLLGNNPRFSRLERIDDGIKIHDKSIRVSRLTYAKYAKNKNPECQVIIVGENNSLDVGSLVKNSSCVVICDDCEKEHEHSAIVVRKENDRIRFDVDLNNANTQKVKFSAKMLELAANIKGLPSGSKNKIEPPSNNLPVPKPTGKRDEHGFEQENLQHQIGQHSGSVDDTSSYSTLHSDHLKLIVATSGAQP